MNQPILNIQKPHHHLFKESSLIQRLIILSIHDISRTRIFNVCRKPHSFRQSRIISTSFHLFIINQFLPIQTITHFFQIVNFITIGHLYILIILNKYKIESFKK